MITPAHKTAFAVNPTRLRTTRWLLRFLAETLFINPALKIETTGQEKIPLTEPTIILFNHVTYFDPLLAGWASKKRTAVPLSKIELMQNPPIALAAWAWGNVPIRRGAVDRAALKQAVALINSDDILMISPEGHRNKDGLRNPAEGTALLANQTSAVMVPIGISGTEHILANLKQFKRTDITINVGRLFKLKQGVTRKQYAKAADEMMYQIAPLVAPELRGLYGDLSQTTMETIEYV
ncbi:MAG: lysophospholipid acyltransferase family protein [Chloroflexota bacterium]